MSYKNRKEIENTEKDFIPVYKNLPEKTKLTVRFFDRGDNFTVHGEDATFIAMHYFGSSNTIRQWKSGVNVLETCHVRKSSLNGVLRCVLIQHLRRVEIWKKNKSVWEIAFKGSPGNFSELEDVLCSDSQLPSSGEIIAVKFTSTGDIFTFGVCSVDLDDRTFKVAQIQDQDTFIHLESLLVQLCPKEIVIPAGSFNNESNLSIKKVFDRFHVLLTEHKKSEFADSEKFIKLLSTESQTLFFSLGNDNLCVGAYCAVSSYLNLLSECNYQSRFRLEFLKVDNLMRLDSSAVRALNLFNPNEEGTQTKYNSLYGVLNHCKTTHGQKLLRIWLKQPLANVDAINERLDLVQFFLNNSEILNNISDRLKRIPDLQRLSRRLLKRSANLQDCYRIYQVIRLIPDVCRTLNTYSGESEALIANVFLRPLLDLMRIFQKFEEMIESTIDLTHISINQFLIKPDFEPELLQLRKHMDSLEDQMKVILNIVINDLNLKSVKLEFSSMFGYHFRVTRKEENVLRKRTEYFTIDVKKDGVRFQNDNLKRLNEDFLDSKRKYDEIQQTVIKEVVKIAAGYVDKIQLLSTTLATMDVFISLAVAATNSTVPYVRPLIHPKGHGLIRMKNCRHAILEMSSSKCFIPNDAYFSKEGKSFYIITGPNMGGKSTFIRQIGLIILMAQTGSFVPCEEAEISIVDSILARLGAGDCITKGISTFMSEMIETSFILRIATPDSFVIIDELGRGTSTFDGFGLAWAITKYIATEINCYGAFATHFLELTELSDVVPSIGNLHMKATTATDALVLLYKISEGVCDQSFGIHVAQLVHFPAHVTELAEKAARQYEDILWTKIFNQSNQTTESKENARILISNAVEDLCKEAEKSSTAQELKSSIQSIFSKLMSSADASLQRYVKESCKDSIWNV